MHFIIHGNILIGTRISLVKVQSNQNKPCKSTSPWYTLQDLTSSCKGVTWQNERFGYELYTWYIYRHTKFSQPDSEVASYKLLFSIFCTVYHKGANLKMYLFQLDWWKYFSVFQQACSVWKFTNSICIRELKFRSIYIYI